MSLYNCSGQSLESPSRIVRRVRPRQSRCSTPTKSTNQASTGTTQHHLQAASPSPRHPTLIPEILYDIFEYIYEDIVDPEGTPARISASRRTLASAARTCRAFSGPALDILWRRLPGVWPLVLVV